MIVLVTGASGMLGHAVTELLRSCGHVVVAHGGRIDGDLRDQKNVDHYFRLTPFDAVVHCAARIGGVGFQRYEQVGWVSDNLVMGSRVIETAAARTNVKRFVFISSSTVYPDVDYPISEDGPVGPPLQYAGIGRVKLFLEGLGRALLGDRFAILRPTAIYGPHDRGFDNDDRGHVIPSLLHRAFNLSAYAYRGEYEALDLFGDPDAVRDFVYVDDVARAVKMAVEDPLNFPVWREPVNIGSGQGTSIRAVAQAVLVATNRPDHPIKVQGPPNDGGLKVRRVSIARAKDLGWEPEVTLTEGLKRTVAWRTGKPA